MKLIVGLGNPGLEYSDTRHNIGFKIIENISLDLSIKFKRYNNARSIIAKDPKKNIILAMPLTFMNISGEAVKKIVKDFEIGLDDILIAYDDLDLELGRIKFSFGTSSGGHKGVESIIRNLDSKNFTRLRFGIGRDSKIETSDFVLSKFKKQELSIVDESVDRAKEACLFWLEAGLVKAKKQVQLKGVI